MSRRRRRRRLHHDEQEMTQHRLMPAPDYANPRESDGVQAADKGSSNQTDVILGLQRTRGNQFVRQLVGDMRGRQAPTMTYPQVQRSLAPTIQRMSSVTRTDTADAALSPQAALILNEWAKQYLHWFVSQVIEMIAESFEKYIEQTKDQAKTQAETGTTSSNSTDVGKQIEEAGGPPNNIFTSLYMMQKGMQISPEFVPVDEWEMPDDVESIEDLFGQEVTEFVSQENTRFAQAKAVDPHAETKPITTPEDLIELLIENGRAWFPTVADPGSPPQ